jgi:hypothetical protein
LTNTASDAFDESVIQRTNWFFYGAGKPLAEAYRVVSCFDRSGVVDIRGQNEMELVKLLSIRRLYASEYTVKKDMKDVW